MLIDGLQNPETQKTEDKANTRVTGLNLRLTSKVLHCLHNSWNHRSKINKQK